MIICLHICFPYNVISLTKVLGKGGGLSLLTVVFPMPDLVDPVSSISKKNVLN